VTAKVESEEQRRNNLIKLRQPHQTTTTTTTTSIYNNNNMPASITSKHKEAFEKCAAAIAPDMPLLMHGAGDVLPQNVDKESAALLARLSADFISKLCGAAVDAHDILTDGAGGMLPPPSLEKKLHPMAYSEESKRKRKTPGEEYWDDPLPMPNIKGAAKTKKHQPWVGLAGVDLQQASRTRKRHVQMPIGTQSFIFPICHDAEMYQRVVQLQAARREIQQVLEDSVITDLLQEELVKQKEDDEDDELIDSEWPGLEALLPIHKFDAEATPAVVQPSKIVSMSKA
jgi:hypothetical protein